MSELDEFFVHELTVRQRTGTTGRGVPAYADPVTVRGFLSRKQRQVRAASGDQVVAQAKFSTGPEHADTLALDSQVTLTSAMDSAGVWQPVAGGISSTIIATAVSTSGDLDLPDHATAYLQ